MNPASIGIGSLALGIAIALYVLKKRGKLLMILMLVIGVAAMPMLSSLLGKFLKTSGGLAAQISIPTVLAAFATTWIILQWKSGASHKATPWIALFTATFWGAAGGIFLTLLTQGQTIVDQLGTTVH